MKKERDVPAPEASLLSNPLQSSQITPPRKNQTLNARVVHSEAQNAFRPLLSGIQTEEDLNTLLSDIEALRYVSHCRFKVNRY